MTPIVDATIRSSVVLAIGLAARGLLRHRSAALRHCVLTIAMICALAVVPLSLVLPGWAVRPTTIAAAPPLSPAASVTTATTASSTAHSARPAPRLNLLWLISFVWIAGLCGRAARLVVGLRRLASVTSRAERLRDSEWTRLVEQASAAHSVGRHVAVFETAAPDLLATWGVIAPCVLLPSGARSWRPDRARVVICHELAHIRRHDWVTQMIGEVLLAIYWFNPLMWMTCSRLRCDSEQACDDAVLRAGIPPRSYAGHLLDLARLCRRQNSAWAFGTPMARRSTLERRIAAMLKSDLDRRTLSSRSVWLTAALLLAVTLPAGAVRLAQSSPLPLRGTVYDSTGAVLPNVEVTLSTAPLDEGQVPQATSTTDAAGRFEMTSVAPGKYVLQASLPAFRQLRQEFELKTTRDWDRAVTLQVGDLRETITVSASRVAPSVSASARPPQPVRVGGTIRAPMKLVDVKPVYPTSMRVAGLEGVVPIEAIIGRDGTVISLRVLSAQVHPDFALAAADAVRQWKFAPTLLNGQPVDVAMTVSVTFKLAD